MTLVAHCVHHTALDEPRYFRVAPGQEVTVGSLVSEYANPDNGRIYHVVEVTNETQEKCDELGVGWSWPYLTRVHGHADRRVCRDCKRRVGPLHTRHGVGVCHGNPAESCYAYGCGLPVHRTCYDRRSYREYCVVHYDEAVRRRERDRLADSTAVLDRLSSMREQREENRRRRRATIQRHVTDEERHVPQYSILADQHRPPPSSDRVLMNVHPDVREALRALLMEPEMRGVGYSAFIKRATEIAWEQIAEQRAGGRATAADPETGYDEYRDINGEFHRVPFVGWKYTGRRLDDGTYKPA